MISYEPFWKTIKKKKISTYSLIKDYGFSKGMLDNLKHGRGISLRTLNDICNKLSIKINDVIEYKKD